MEPLRRKDTSKGPPLRILSLDGGGVRGYSMILILQELMHRTFVEIEGKAPRRTEIPKPCDHFDLIVGTGTGGLIAIMLGRLRLDLETCKELYVRLTRMVFETDKTIAGIPYRSTLFKATRLEDAIKECVQEHTVDEGEGNDGTEGSGASTLSPLTASARSSARNSLSPRRHSSNASIVSFSARSPTTQMSRPIFSGRGAGRRGDPNARLYDERANRSKTAVTAVYKGTQKGGDPALLRSYDSRKEPAPEFDCKIWEAGRATCAIGLAFKPIQIGQSVFHDDGAGHYNPSPTALDEAVVNEWPGRDVGVFVSVGTGKRPRGSDAASAAWYDGFLGEFADARRKLIAKIEGCERIHELMRTEHLARRGVNVEAYYRLNVEVGVGEFGMNEWHRLADISTNTRRYMARSDEQKLVQGASAKLAKIHLAKLRWHRTSSAAPAFQDTLKPAPAISSALAVELPGDIPVIRTPNSASDDRRSYDSGVDDMAGPPDANVSPETSSIHVVETPSKSTTKQRLSPGPAASGPVPAAAIAEAAVDPDRLIVIAPTPAQYQDASEAGRSDDARARAASFAGYHAHAQPPPRIEPPPLPPKTPLSGWDAAPGQRMPTAAPYPTDDEPPPVVNVAGKPRYTVR